MNAYLYEENAVGLSLFNCERVTEAALTELSVQRSRVSFTLFSAMVRFLLFRQACARQNFDGWRAVSPSKPC
jgi:hypothetical protein